MNRPAMLAVTYGAYNAVRMLIGVYHVIFLISTGISLPQLALLQVVFSVTVLLLDFPCAVLADRYGRKQSVLAGVLLSGLFYLLCLQAPDMTALIFSEICYAAGICLITGVTEGWIYHSSGNRQDRFSYYEHLCQRVSSLGSVISGITGMAIIYYSGEYVTGYMVSCGMMGVIFLLFLLVPEEKIAGQEAIKHQTVLQNVKQTLWIFTTTQGGMGFIVLICLLSAGMQVIYHFWQPVMLSGEKIDQLNGTQMLILMFCHAGAFFAQYFSNSQLSKYPVCDEKYHRMIKYFPFFSSAMCVVLYLLVQSSQIIAAIIAFSLIHGFTGAVPAGAKSLFITALSEKQTRHISAVVSAASFCGRVFSIVVLSLLAGLPDNIAPPDYLVLPAVIFFLCGLVAVRWTLLS